MMISYRAARWFGGLHCGFAEPIRSISSRHSCSRAHRVRVIQTDTFEEGGVALGEAEAGEIG